MEEKKNYNPELEEEYLDEEYLEDIEYVQAPFFKELLVVGRRIELLLQE